MLEDGKITNQQFIFVYILSRLMLTMTYLSYFKAPPGNQDLWISAILALPMHILLALPVYFLAQRFKNLSVIQSSEVILGHMGKLIGVLYIWFFLHRTSITLRELGEFLTAVPYPETPILVFISITALFTAYAVYQGIETICRVAQIVLPIIFLSILLIFILLTKEMDMTNLLPVFESGIIPVVYGAFVIASRTTVILAVLMLLPFINIPQKTKNYLFLSFVILSVYYIAISVSAVTIFGVEQAKALAFPFYYTVRMISIADFLERIDAIFFAIWVLGMFINTATFYYLTVLATAQLLKLSDYRPIILAIGTIIVSLSISQSDNMIAFNEFLSYKIFTWYALFFSFVLPLFLLVVAIIRKKGVDSR